MAVWFKEECVNLMRALLLFHCFWLLKSVCAITVALAKVIASAFVYDQINLLLYEHDGEIPFSNFDFAEWIILMDIFVCLLYLKCDFYNMLVTFHSVSSKR